jgi:hypothetical protein
MPTNLRRLDLGLLIENWLLLNTEEFRNFHIFLVSQLKLEVIIEIGALMYIIH